MNCDLPEDVQSIVKQSRKGFRLLGAVVTACIWVSLSLVSLPIILYTWPEMETKIWPVLVDQSVSDIHVTSDGRFQKFVWHYTKNRRARIEFAAFMAFVDPREKYTADVFVGNDCNDSFRTSRQTEVGQRMDKLLCVRIPEPLRGKGPLEIRGLIEWNVGHGLYTVPEVFPIIDATQAKAGRTD